MSATVTPPAAKTQSAKITSKGQITIPVEVRRMLGAKTGDKVVFQRTDDGIVIHREGQDQKAETGKEPVRDTGDWLPPGYEGIEGVVRYFREMRGHDEVDDLLFGKE